jgi:hypothetical protein
MQPYEPTVPLPSPGAGWYPLRGELRYWDGREWTQHVAPMSPPSAPVPMGYGAPQPYTTITTQTRTNGVEVAFAWIFTVITVGYFLPWAVAATRGKSNSLAIALLNLLLGWTLIGWVVALVMACTAHQVVSIQQRY